MSAHSAAEGLHNVPPLPVQYAESAEKARSGSCKAVQGVVPDLPAAKRHDKCRRLPSESGWARSSAGERLVDIEEVPGSIPGAPTIDFPRFSGLCSGSASNWRTVSRPFRECGFPRLPTCTPDRCQKKVRNFPTRVDAAKAALIPGRKAASETQGCGSAPREAISDASSSRSVPALPRRRESGMTYR